MSALSELTTPSRPSPAALITEPEVKVLPVAAQKNVTFSPKQQAPQKQLVEARPVPLRQREEVKESVRSLPQLPKMVADALLNIETQRIERA